MTSVSFLTTSNNIFSLLESLTNRLFEALLATANVVLMALKILLTSPQVYPPSSPHVSLFFMAVSHFQIPKCVLIYHFVTTHPKTVDLL